MISIDTPKVYSQGNFHFFSAKYVDDYNQISTDIYFKTDENWSRYFSSMADAWLLLALLPAIKSGQDITINAPVSSELLFSIENYLHRMFGSMYNLDEKIQIVPSKVIHAIEEKGHAIGCGCSLGVDSLSAIKRYSDESLDSAYRLTHLALFNIGAFGNDNLEKASISFQRTFAKAKQYAEEKGLPLVGVESNASLLYRNWEYEQVHSICNLSVVFAMRKLFCTYYYASSYPIELTHITSNSMSYLDSLLIPLLSSNSLKLYVADADKDRVEKTKYIADDYLVQKYLNVCCKSISENGLQVTDNEHNMSLWGGVIVPFAKNVYAQC